MSDEPTPEAPNSNDRRPKFYGRRKGRGLKASQERLLQERLPDFAVTPQTLLELKDCGLTTLFPNPVDDVWLEIGFGGGEHLLWQARRHTDVGMIGCEPFLNGVAKLVRDCDAEGIENVRICADDARQLLDGMPEASIGRLFILFTDPWPKKRHWFRRFVGPENLPRLVRVLKDGGELRLASDHPGYVDWMMSYCLRLPELEWLDEGPRDWSRRPDDWPATRYEEKALAGRPYYFRFRRRNR